jgi:biotin carboxyl carrier protein
MTDAEPAASAPRAQREPDSRRHFLRFPLRMRLRVGGRTYAVANASPDGLAVADLADVPAIGGRLEGRLLIEVEKEDVSLDVVLEVRHRTGALTGCALVDPSPLVDDVLRTAYLQSLERPQPAGPAPAAGALTVRSARARMRTMPGVGRFARVGRAIAPIVPLFASFAAAWFLGGAVVKKALPLVERLAARIAAKAPAPAPEPTRLLSPEAGIVRAAELASGAPVRRGDILCVIADASLDRDLALARTAAEAAHEGLARPLAREARRLAEAGARDRAEEAARLYWQTDERVRRYRRVNTEAKDRRDMIAARAGAEARDPEALAVYAAGQAEAMAGDVLGQPIGLARVPPAERLARLLALPPEAGGDAPADLESASGAAAGAEGRLGALLRRREALVIRSPCDGRVLAVRASSGARVAAGDVLYVLAPGGGS